MFTFNTCVSHQSGPKKYVQIAATVLQVLADRVVNVNVKKKTVTFYNSLLGLGTCADSDNFNIRMTVRFENLYIISMYDASFERLILYYF